MIYGGLFDLDSKLDRKKELDSIINDVSFWNSDNREEIIKENNLIEILNIISTKIIYKYKVFIIRC